MSLLAAALSLAPSPFVGREIFLAPLLGAVMVAAWYGGLGPGVAAIATSLVITESVLAPLGFRSPGAVRLAVFSAVALLISLLTHARLTAERALRQKVSELHALDEDRRRLLAAEQAERARAEASERRLVLLAEVSQRLLSTLDYRATLARVVEALVPWLADGCIVYLREGDGVQRVAYRHTDPHKQDLMRQMDERYRVDLAADSPPARTLRTGRPVMAHDDPSTGWRGVVKDEAHRRLLDQLSPRSYMVVPLAARDRVFGAMFLLVTESARQYTEEDLAFAGHLARRAAVAIENARLYGEAQQARHDAEAANRAKDEFLATVSHELRTPLNAILGWAVLLGKRRLDAGAAARAVESIERNARLQAQLIDDLLDVARITSGQLRLDVRVIDLAPVIEAAVDSLRPAADAKGITIETRFDPAAGPVRGDPDRLQQVVWNLVSNAVKFTGRGGHVRVALTRDEVDARIVVADTGQGIPRHLIGEIFDPFKQGEPSVTRRHGGLGLGLSIVRHLVELHGGGVRVDSPGPGQGSIFTVTLPLAPPGSASG